MLDYRFNEGPRSQWLTGEIFVDEGLEDALNIDGDSFNRFHPEFRAIQNYVHKILRDDVFPDVYRQISVRSSSRESSREEARIDRLQEVHLLVSVETPVKIREEKTSSSEETPQVAIVSKAKGVEIVLPNPEDLRTKKSQRQLAAAALAIYEIAMQEKTRDKQRAVFTELLLELLAGW